MSNYKVTKFTSKAMDKCDYTVLCSMTIHDKTLKN